MSSSCRETAVAIKGMFDFRCEDGHITERFVSYEVTESECETCGKAAKKQLSAPTIYLEPYSGLHPSASSKWEKKRAEKLKQEQKQNQA